MIPRRLIRCVPAVTPDDQEEYWHQWQQLHPSWEFVTYRDPIDPAGFPLLGDLFDQCVHGAQLAGLVRLEAVWHLGGIYVDADMEPLRAIDDLLVHPCFIGTEDGYHLTDAMFGAEPNHPGIRACIDRVKTLDMSSGPGVTGPHNTTAVLKDRPDVTVLAQRMFYPYTYLEKERAGEDFAETSPESYAVHRWAFSWRVK